MTSPLPVESAPLPMKRVDDEVFISPLVRASVASTVTLPPSEMPFARLIVRFFTMTEGSVVLAPDPPKVIFELLPPVKLPLVVEMAPLSVSVFAPIENAPLVRVSMPLVAVPAVSETPALLLIVRLLTVDGKPLPVACAALPLYV